MDGAHWGLVDCAYSCGRALPGQRGAPGPGAARAATDASTPPAPHVQHSLWGRDAGHNGTAQRAHALHSLPGLLDQTLPGPQPSHNPSEPRGVSWRRRLRLPAVRRADAALNKRVFPNAEENGPCLTHTPGRAPGPSFQDPPSAQDGGVHPGLRRQKPRLHRLAEPPQVRPAPRKSKGVGAGEETPAGRGHQHRCWSHGPSPGLSCRI